MNQRMKQAAAGHREPACLMRRRPTVGARITLVVALVAGCGTNGPETEKPGRPQTPAAAATASPDRLTGLFSAGPMKLSIECQGSGSPTVVFLHGMDGTASQAAATMAAIAPRTRFCAYDRPGQGSSEELDGTQTGADAAEHLRRLLASAGVPPPYVLLGGSHGALIATIYAGTYPDEVAGVVYIDGSLPIECQEVDQMIPEPDGTQVRADVEDNPERFVMYGPHGTCAQATAALTNLPHVPMIYLQATQRDEFPDHWPAKKMKRVLEQGLSELVAGFRRGRVVPVDSPHYPFPEPPIQQAINDVLDAAGAR